MRSQPRECPPCHDLTLSITFCPLHLSIPSWAVFEGRRGEGKGEGRNLKVMRTQGRSSTPNLFCRDKQRCLSKSVNVHRRSSRLFMCGTRSSVNLHHLLLFLLGADFSWAASKSPGSRYSSVNCYKALDGTVAFQMYRSSKSCFSSMVYNSAQENDFVAAEV